MRIFEDATIWQWGLLWGFLALLIASVVVRFRRPRLRPATAFFFVLALPHVVYYALFLIWPDFLNAEQTRDFSILLRYQVLFMAAFIFAWVGTQDRWR